MLIVTMLLTLLLGTLPTAAAAEKIMAVHLVDLSQSTGDQRRSVSALLQQIQTAGKDDRIIVVGFGKNAQVLLRATMPSQSGPKDINMIKTRQAAAETFQRNLKNRVGQLDRSSTDILGALLQAQRIFEESGASVKRLYLYSDLLDTATLQMDITPLSSPDGHQRYLQKAVQKQVILPQLDGVEVVLYTLLHQGQWRMTQEQEIARRELRAVWEELFRQSHGQVVGWHTVD